MGLNEQLANLHHSVERLNELQELIIRKEGVLLELAAAAEDMKNSGAHEGECAFDLPGGGCSTHLAHYGKRSERLEKAVKAFRELNEKPVDGITAKQVIDQSAETAKVLDETGLLFEINRRVLHPLGYAIALHAELEEGPWYIHGIRKTDDPEGFIFGESAYREGSEKFEKFMANGGLARLEKRLQKLGFTEQYEETAEGQVQ